MSREFKGLDANGKMTRTVREAVLAVIPILQEEPRRFNLAYWFSNILPERINERTTFNRCGTAACIAGWMIANEKRGFDINKEVKIRPDNYGWLRRRGALGGYLACNTVKLDRENPYISAQEWLEKHFGLPLDFFNSLFLPDQWEEPFQGQLAAQTSGTAAYAQVAINYIRHWVDAR